MKVFDGPVAHARWTWQNESRIKLLRPKTLGDVPHLDHPSSGAVPIYTINEVINVLVPLTLCDAHVGIGTLKSLTALKKIDNVLHAEPIHTYVHENFKINFSLRTTRRKQSKQLVGPTKLCRSLKDDNILSGVLLPGMSMTNPSFVPKRVSAFRRFSPKPKLAIETFREQMEKTK